MPPQVRLLLLVLFSLFPALPSSASFAAPRILCLGDSLTEGLGVAADKAWPALVEKSLHENGFKDAVVINAGVSGATSASGPGRLKWHLKGAAKPDLVILELGANDGLRGQDVKAMRRNLEESIHLAKAGAPLSGDPLYLAGGRLTSARSGDCGYRLHASALRFRHPATGRVVKLRCAPSWLDAWWDDGLTPA